MLMVPLLVNVPPLILIALLVPPFSLIFNVPPLPTVKRALKFTSILFNSGTVPVTIGLLVVFGIIALVLLTSGTQAGFQLQAVFQSVLTSPVQVILILPGDEAKGVHSVTVTETFGLESLTQVFAPVHFA